MFMIPLTTSSHVSFFVIKELCVILPFFFSNFCLFFHSISIYIYIFSHWMCICLSSSSPLPVPFLPYPLSLPLLLCWTTPLCLLPSWRIVGVHEQAHWWDQLSISSQKNIDLASPHMSLCTASHLSCGPRGNSEAVVRRKHHFVCVKCSSRSLKLDQFECVCKRECECA